MPSAVREFDGTTDDGTLGDETDSYELEPPIKPLARWLDATDPADMSEAKEIGSGAVG